MTDRRTALGAWLLVATVQYLIAEAVTAVSWSPVGYSYARNYISDLGVPECLTLDRTVCSPLWFVMDASFVVQGIITFVALVLLARLVPRGWRIPVVGLGVIYCVGIVIVGLFPGSTAEVIGGSAFRATMHSLGALLAILGGNVWALVAGVALLPRWRGWALCSILLGVFGIAAGIISTRTDLGLGVGGIERLAVYPIIGWLILTGAALLAARRTGATGGRAGR
ncbi:DUF998 domain-containing protein [Epidermidibacterium keratini]